MGDIFHSVFASQRNRSIEIWVESRYSNDLFTEQQVHHQIDYHIQNYIVYELSDRVIQYYGLHE